MAEEFQELDEIVKVMMLQGAEGTSIADITQTTSSDESEGDNVITITLTNGQKYTFNYKNGKDGTNGVGVQSIEQTQTSTTSGGTNEITATLTDGTTTKFYVKNGKDGSGGGANVISYDEWSSYTDEQKSTSGDVLVTDYPTEDGTIVKHFYNGVAVGSEPTASTDFNDVYDSDEYQSTTTYAQGDTCIFNNKLYKCILSCIGVEPTNTTYWERVSLSSITNQLENYVEYKKSDDGTKEYYKYADGTLINTFIKTYNTTATSQWGALYQTPQLTGEPWLHPFISEPTATASVKGYAGWFEGLQAGKDSTGNFYLCRATQLTSWSTTVKIIAIGRWK